ncbi:MAG TPA: hypothetical protein VLZ78_07125, partial [Terrimesophilobacter sp.]|nr:hypothetical protein [Terrimesophilobacter sp.]
FPRALYQSLHADVHRLASLVRSYRPASICPWCKWDGLIVAECPGCEGAGWVSAEKADRAPRELLDGTNPVVFVRGRAVPLGQVLAHITPSTGAASPKKGGKQIKVEGPDGRVGTIAESDDGPTIVYDEPAADDEEIPL